MVTRIGIQSGSPVVEAGLRALLGSHPDQVHIASPGQRVELLVYDLATPRRPLTLPTASVPLIALVHEGDTTALNLAATHGVPTVHLQAGTEQLIGAVLAAAPSSDRGVDPASQTLSSRTTEPTTFTARERQVMAYICADHIGGV